MSASPQRQGLLFLLIGPPGAGKNALMNDALERVDNLRQLATATTRASRPAERQGREHLFVSKAEFQRMMDEGKLLEWQQVHGKLYGIPRQTVEDAIGGGRDLTADIDVLGATYLRSLYPNNVILIFIKPSVISELENRMRTRGETETEIATRLKRVEMEMSYAPLCDYIIINDDLKQAADKLFEIIQTERQRRQDNAPALRKYIHVAAIIPIYANEALQFKGEPHFPELTIPQGELPHKVALGLLEEHLHIPAQASQLFKTAAHEGSFIPPVSVNVVHHEEIQQITFLYVYILPKRVQPPPDWAWVPYQQAGLPTNVLEALHEQMIPGD